MASINLIVYNPKTEDGKKLTRRVSDIHAAALNQRLKLLTRPTSQKLELLDRSLPLQKKN